MLRIVELPETPATTVDYHDRLKQTGEIGRKQAPVLIGSVEGLPPRVGGLACLADLQGRVGTAEQPELPVFEAIRKLESLERGGRVPPLKQMVAVCAGDLWAYPMLHKRGGSGDVRQAWLALRDRFLAVVGVAGNHDRFGETDTEYHEFRRAKGVHLLNVDAVRIAGLHFAGVSGVIGDPNKRPFRHTEEDFHAGLDLALHAAPDVLVLHQGPLAGTDHRHASPGIRERCARLQRGIVVWGHNYTERALERLPNGAQFLSVHERVVVLNRAE